MMIYLYGSRGDLLLLALLHGSSKSIPRLSCSWAMAQSLLFIATSPSLTSAVVQFPLPQHTLLLVNFNENETATRRAHLRSQPSTELSVPYVYRSASIFSQPGLVMSFWAIALLDDSRDAKTARIKFGGPSLCFLAGKWWPLLSLISASLLLCAFRRALLNLLLIVIWSIWLEVRSRAVKLPCDRPCARTVSHRWRGV